MPHLLTDRPWARMQHMTCYNCWGSGEIEVLRFLKGMDNQTLAALMKDWWALAANRCPLSLLSADPSSVWTGVGFCQGHTQEQPGTECPLPPRLHARRPPLGSLHSGAPSYKILVYLGSRAHWLDSQIPSTPFSPVIWNEGHTNPNPELPWKHWQLLTPGLQVAGVAALSSTAVFH